MTRNARIGLVALAVICAAAGPALGAVGAATEAPKEAQPGRWNTYHGGPSLDGVAEGSLPDTLTPRWRFMAGAPVRTTPVAGGGRIYFANVKGRLFAVDLRGAEVWSKTIPREKAVSRFSPDEQFDAPLACFGDTLLAGSADGVLYALDAATGEIRWRADLDGTLLGSPNVDAGTRPARVFAIEQSMGVLHCLDFDTGEPVWRAQGVDRCDGSAGLGGGVLVLGSCMAALHVFSADTGELLREVPIDPDSQVAAGVAVLGDAAFSGSRSGKVLQIDTKSGEIKWINADCTDEVFSTPAVDAAHVVFGSEAGDVYAVARADGRLLWTFSARGPATSAVLAGDKAVVAADGVLYVLGLADGKPLWSYEVCDDVTAPAVIDGMVIVGCDDGSVAAFGAPAGKGGPEP
ncbi:MAG: PQQ-binding-like beta-propeller repeat protein [Candidatus Hydrogenedentes bacterium]|nr:PQQ-binding-like beta-propeller repeat protein [Candidatus Hydrogenedentota bacterium]